MGDLTAWPAGAAGAASATGAAGAPPAGAAAGAATMATGCCITRGAPLDLTMRTLPSASVISSSDTLDSETRSIRVLSFLRSMGSPTTVDAGRQDQHAAFLKWKSENESVGNKVPIF